ncbi:MAG: hypothetical protein JO261_03760 [Alphaproteobacteria bacterium]|nr:hypothetical protein [Alphaproteobacteria bacterium]MBV9692796.1 hypothetical protein [Alphaproteobacteria bacterium]
MELLDTWWAIIRDGLHHINTIQLVIIALLIGFMASSVVSVIAGALAGAVAYIAVDVLWPVVFQHQPFAMPVMDRAFGHFFVALYFAFLLVIALVYVVRSIISGVRG